MECITAAGNTEVPAYLTLLKQGWTVELNSSVPEEEFWVARKGELLLQAEGLLELLGLTLMRADRGEDWHAEDEEIDGFLAKFFPDGDAA
jgi:hypothetical protein